ncbi:conserved hypothetical protein [Denitrovibrio acetiphilus DSM 12809]|uniref:Chemotaxis methyl-accepting receptor HlyB-like 4HB MCP domain-containing protein n=1 Tax=Denitrovibrio acetiphilus (strain DSM 12809 / NBRC 114555 / N2460) TaxID=522772 RepID=D4H7Q8_DENA2|nr:hypothetical protein [Denitrovibrio acetiphilus]ADD68057.1 conserved hypothetical protein [Denitrovibrio acetiphilus DSM 12809]
MRNLHSFKIGAWLIISLNVLMAFGAIWMFMRMSPAIEQIIERNEVSLEACEDMLGAIAVYDGVRSDSLPAIFAAALKRAENNITEKGETSAIEVISKTYESALAGDAEDKAKTINAIRLLGQINRHAMTKADMRAKQIGNAGAWGIVFMATIVFISSMMSVRFFNRHIAGTLEEINAVLRINKHGDKFRRCAGSTSKDSLFIYNEINSLLDRANFPNKNDTFK